MSAPSPTLDIDLHVRYIQQLDQKQDLAYHLTEHLRLNGVYWGLTALHIMGRPGALPREPMVEYVMSCWDDEAGAFGAHTGHDGHIHSTLSAVQILLMQDALAPADVDRIVSFLVSLVNADGSVAGDQWGESDTRFTYILVACLSLLGRLDALDAPHRTAVSSAGAGAGADGGAAHGAAAGPSEAGPSMRARVTDNVRRSMNFDGSFGSRPGAESHGAQVWVSVGALAILGRLDIVDADLLGAWLSERQLPNGGLNGRPEKLEDVCYSWWNVASLSILGKLHWINRDALVGFILGAQDLEDGGIADRPGDWVDVFHTVFGLAGLSLVGFPGLDEVDPFYCLPAKLTRRLGLRGTYQVLERMRAWPEA
ncbi:Rab geranylgeranyltransferase [Cryptotrichosporon argae]